MLYRHIVPATAAPLVLALLFTLSGCTAEDYKEQADRDVYDILDTKWQEGFGEQANYRIADVAPSPNDIILDTASVSQRLSLREAVRLAIAQNRAYQDQKEALYSEALALTLQRHNFARQYFGTLDGQYLRDAADVETAELSASVGFTQLLADGAQIAVSITGEWLRFLSGGNGSDLSSLLAVSITQPLLRGAGRKIVMEDLTQQERETLYELRKFARFRKTFLVSVISEYLRVLQARDAVRNNQSNYETLKLSEERLRMLAQAGRLPRFEVEQAQQQTLQSWDRYIGAQERYRQNLDDFKINLGISPDVEIELDPNELLALEQIDITPPEFDVNHAIATALTQRLDLATAADRVFDRERKVDVAKDQLRAELNISGGMNSGSDDSRFADLFFDDDEYRLGFELDLPFDRLSERNNYRQTLINLMRQKRDYSLDVDQVKLAIRSDYRNLREAAQRYDIQQMSLHLAQRRVENTDLLLQAGRAITRDLLEAQSDLLNAQNFRTEALVSYVIASLNFSRDLGVLEVKADGSWVQDDAWLDESVKGEKSAEGEKG